MSMIQAATPKPNVHTNNSNNSNNSVNTNPQLDTFSKRCRYLNIEPMPLIEQCNRLNDNLHRQISLLISEMTDAARGVPSRDQVDKLLSIEDLNREFRQLQNSILVMHACNPRMTPESMLPLYLSAIPIQKVEMESSSRTLTLGPELENGKSNVERDVESHSKSTKAFVSVNDTSIYF